MNTKYCFVKSTSVILHFVMLILLFTSISTAQEMVDVVYLKNGTVIHGIIIEQVPGKTIKIKTYDSNIFVYSLDEVAKITKESNNNITPYAGGVYDPIESQIIMHPLGFLQAGPIIQALFKVAPNTIIGPHIRFAGLGLLYVENVSTDADKVSPTSIAAGIEVKYYFDNSNSHDRWYLGGLAEYGYGSWSGAVGYLDEWKGEHTYWDFLLNGGYCWRFSEGIIINLGAFLGVAKGIERQWWYIYDSGIKFPDETDFEAIYMLELSFGIEI